MNYIILNNKEYFKNLISFTKIKEVKGNNDRCDAVIGEITTEILEQLYSEPERRDRILQDEWLLRDRGVSFILCKIDTSILHNKDSELIEKLLGLYNKENFFIEIRSYHNKQSYNQIESYIFCYNKNFGYQNDILPDVIEENILQTLCEKIEKKIL